MAAVSSSILDHFCVGRRKRILPVSSLPSQQSFESRRLCAIRFIVPYSHEFGRCARDRKVARICGRWRIDTINLCKF